MRVLQAAKQLGISTSTVRKYCREGTLEFTLNPAGQRLITQGALDKFIGKNPEIITVYYVRSSSGDKALTEGQLISLTEAYGEPAKVYRDSGSGLNENRVNLQRLLRDAGKGKFTRVCVTYEDRLARFGVEYIRQLLAKDNVELIVQHENVKHSLEEELLKDFMNIIASFSGKFYRLRSREAQEQLLDKARGELQ